MKNHLDHNFFKNVKIEELNVANFESKLNEASSELVGIKWFHVNTYENFELGTQFGLFGIPTFIFFHKDKRLGRISPFPGVDPFFSALDDLKTKIKK